MGLINLFTWSKHEDTLSPEGGECDSEQLPWWSSGYDAHPTVRDWGFDPLLRHWTFRSVGTHCYIILIFQNQMDKKNFLFMLLNLKELNSARKTDS